MVGQKKKEQLPAREGEAMSTKDERTARAQRVIAPVAVSVKQPDGTVLTQVVDADVRTKKPRRGWRKRYDELKDER